jgi:hypothetical protein
MMNLKTFESFSMRRENCDRCKGPTDNETTQSMFNEEVICITCKDNETKDPEYDAACKADQEAYLSGERNFKGALPDYKPLERG